MLMGRMRVVTNLGDGLLLMAWNGWVGEEPGPGLPGAAQWLTPVLYEGSPDLSDPATVGALHGLACEVCGPVSVVAILLDGSEWQADAERQGPSCTGPTPGEALAQLLLEVWTT